MAKLEDAMAYFCVNYPHKSDLSKARLTKMIYLADWRKALQAQSQMTNLEWVFNHYGPYLDDIKTEATKNPRFNVKSSQNYYGSPKDVIEVRSARQEFPTLKKSDTQAMDHVIEKTKNLTWGPFIKLVYSTYPIATQPRYEVLDLRRLAAQYQKERKLIK